MASPHGDGPHNGTTVKEPDVQTEPVSSPTPTTTGPAAAPDLHPAAPRSSCCEGDLGHDPDDPHSLFQASTDLDPDPGPDLGLVPTFGRGVLLLTGSINFGLAVGLPIAFSVMFLEWQDTFGTSRGLTAAVHSTCVGILFAGGVVAGYIMNRFGPRITLILGTLLACTGVLLGAFAPTIEALIATCGVIAGCGFCLLQLPCIPCSTRFFPNHQSLAIAACLLGGSIIGAALPYFYEYLIKLYSWRGAFIVISALILNTLVFDLLMTSMTKPHRNREEHTSSSETKRLMPNSSYDLPAVKIIITPPSLKGDGSMRSLQILGSRNSIASRTDDSQVVESCDENTHCNLENSGQSESREVPSTQNVDSSLNGSLPKGSNSTDDNRSISMSDEDQSLPLNHTNKTKSDKQSTPHVAETPPYQIKSDLQIKEEKNNFFSDIEGGNETNTSMKPDCENENKSIVQRIRSSPWKFLLDPLAASVMLILAVCLASAFSAIILLMDISDTKGSPDLGVLLILLTFVTSLAGKIIAGALGMWQALPSFVLLALAGALAGVFLIVLGAAGGPASLVIGASGLGLCVGILVTVYPKCFLDLPTVDEASYPLALGLGSTAEGIGDFLLPIIIGAMADSTRSYEAPLSFVGVASLLCSAFVVVVFFWSKLRVKVKG